MLRPGDTIDARYEILAPLAEGGMGAVYRARRILLGDEVAIKIVRPDQTSPSARERFLRESRVAASLRHPAIVSIFDFDMPPQGDPYLVMELLSGPSLREEILSRGRLDVADVLRIIPAICSALELTHSHGVVHRDLKPANIVAHDYDASVPRGPLSGGRAYKLVDFGIANLRQSTDDTRITAAHQFVGTVAYAAPEQIGGREVDARTDVYSLAAVVFEMLTGSVPFPGPDIISIVSAQLAKPAPAIRSLRADVPEWIDAAVSKGLQRHATDRWQSVAEFHHALTAAAGGTTTVTVTSPRRAGALAETYELGEFLGRGRLGSKVFRGMHRALGHPVAIRILEPGDHPNVDAVRERFLREARALQIAHPSIIQVRDYGEDDASVFVVTDYIEGPSLREVLAKEGRLAWRRLRPLLVQLTEAARLLHRKKALICGLNPDIMRVRAPEPDDDEERVLLSTAGIWTPQDLLATLNERTLRGVALEDVELRYVAPELLTGGTVDVRSDVFTLGVVAYEMATGQLPYDGRSMPELLGRMLAGAPADPRVAAPDLPEAAAAAILRALRPKPEERFATAKEFATALL